MSISSPKILQFKLTNYLISPKTHRLCVFVMCNIYPLSVIQVINVYLPLAITRHKGNSIAIIVELELQQRHTILKVRHRHGSYRINQRSLSISVEKFYPTRDRIKVTTSGFNTHSLAIRFSYRQAALRKDVHCWSTSPSAVQLFCCPQGIHCSHVMESYELP